MSLTPADRNLIEAARKLAETAGPAALRELLPDFGATPGDLQPSPYPFAFGIARHYLTHMADLAERLGGEK